MSKSAKSSVVESNDASVTHPSGRFLDACRIDLPPDDVVEEIEFEKFFRLKLHLGDFMDQGSGTPDTKPKSSVPKASKPKKGQEPVEPEAGLDPRELGLALFMPFLQQWKLDGYSRGRIVNSFSLGPGEEQTVEIFTWAKSSSSLTSATAFESEETTESSSTRRDASDVSRDVSKQTGFELTTGGKVGFKVGVVDVDMSGGAATSANAGDAEKETRAQIVEATSRSTSNVRTSRTLTVTETQESGREERVTRKLVNPNSCHTLTVPFFEVLANYEVSTFLRAEEVRLVALIESSMLHNMVAFDRDSVRVHETSLRLALLERTLAPGFEAARFLDARERACEILCHQCACGDEDAGETDSDEWDAVVKAARKIADAVATIRSKSIRFPLSVVEVAPPPFGLGATVPGRKLGIDDIESHMFAKALAANAPGLLADLAGTGVAGGTAPVTASQVRAMARAISALPPPAIAMLTFDPNVSNQVGWEIYGAVLLFVPEFITAGIVAGQVRTLADGLGKFKDEGLVSAMNSFNGAYSEWTKKMEASRKDDEKERELARIAREERSLRILESFGLRQTAEAGERLSALLDHLNDPRNIDHYRFAVWNERSGAADDRVTALALAGVIDSTPVGVVGDQLAVPVRLEHEPKLAKFFKTSMAQLLKTTPRDVRRHILPTAALYSEAVVGQCCACEDSIVKQKKLEADAAGLRNDLLRLEKQRLEGRLGEKHFDKEFPKHYELCLHCGEHHGPDAESDATA